MKKRKRAARSSWSSDDDVDEDEVEETVDETEIEEVKHPGPHDVTGIATSTAQAARLPSSYCGTAAIRGHADKTTPIVSDYAIAFLPPYAAVFAGGVWVSEAFDSGAVLELGNVDDPNTYISVPLDVVGFTPVTLKPAGAPIAEEAVVLGRIEGVTELTQGRVDFILVYG